MPNLSEKFREFPELNKNSTVPYFSAGDFSMHEVLEYLLQMTGPANVSISSFSITEPALRSFARLIESGQITGIRCLFDFSVKQHTLGILYFASNIVNEIGLDKCHAKIMLISNSEWEVAIISSANFNVNDKKEAGIISTENRTYTLVLAKYNDWFESSVKISADEFN